MPRDTHPCVTDPRISHLRDAARRRYLTAGLGLAAAGMARAQDAYPSRAITIVVPFAVGGSTDVASRLVAQTLTGTMKQPVIVENRTGGAGVVGWQSVARAAPDGYTLLTVELSYAIAAGLIPNLPFDPRKSFIQISTAVTVPHVLVINPAVPAKTVQEFIALAKSQPGKLFYGSGGNGTNTHLGSELFKNLAGIDMTHVPYKGAGAVLQDLMGGQVQALVTSVPTALPHVKSGKLRALMVASDKRIAVLPDVPSTLEVGLPKMVMQFWVGFGAPAHTPQPIIDRLNRELLAMLKLPDTQKRLTELGLETVGNTPAEATQLVDSEIVRWTAVIKAANIKAD